MRRLVIDNARKAVGFPYLSQQLSALAATDADLLQKLEVMSAQLRALQSTVAGQLNVLDQSPPALEPSKPHWATPFGKTVVWETAIQHCARDCVAADSTILDIGGNVGGLAVAFSRMVPAGHVYSFEPNPELWADIQGTLSVNDAKNVTHVPLACFTDSGKLLEFFSEPGLYKAASGLMKELPGAKRFRVATIGVDDFCEANELTPALIKVDVEGAEIHVLRSAKRIIKRARPAFILEYLATDKPDENDPLIFLERAGYIFFDVNTYEEVSASKYGKSSGVLVNTLCLHQSTSVAKQYRSMQRKQIHRITEIEGLRVEADIGPGRHIIRANVELHDEAVASLSVRHADELIVYNQAPGKNLRHHSVSSLVIDVETGGNVEIVMDPKSPVPAALVSIDIHSISI